MINYLFSGIDKEKGFTKEQTNYLKKDIKSNKTIVFIASVFSDSLKSESNYKRLVELFNNIGISFKDTILIDGRMTKEEAKEVLNDCDYVLLMGGSPDLQMKSIIEYDLSDEIKKVGIVLGISAGSMNQAKRVMYKDDYENYIMKDYPGLNLVPISIFPHFDFNNEAFVEEANEISNQMPLVLLPNDSFVRVVSGEVEYIGEHYLIEKEKVKSK